ncbi:MAG: phenylalanine--tRNA ligase subunit beta [Acidobacteria bacterium]|nr:phenylalanine--tRNA ligase subunit beta [Acidobacteriota bacterium]
MRFCHGWLKEYVTITDEPARVGALLTGAGVPLDGITGAGDDAVYDFEILTNRPDCMNHVGLARELAALTGRDLRIPETDIPAGGPPSSEHAGITIEDPDLCARYSGRCILGARIGPSPDWLARRLISIGQRPINNVVDVTNFVLWEFGQPLHAFDLDRLADHRIVVRRARRGEILVTLDGESRTLTADMLVIADAKRPVALAGVMGGHASEISDATTRILLESAWFEPVSVRRTARALGLHTDASHRFERGADPALTVTALDRAAALIAEVAGGQVTGPALDIHPRPEPPRVVPFRPARARQLLGLDLPADFMRERLTRLQFKVREADRDSWQVTVPSFRRDVTREVDLIEEVIRQRGYDAIGAELPQRAGTGRGRSNAARRSLLARQAFQSAGIHEAVNSILINREDAAPFAPPDAKAKGITNPLQSQAAWLRMSLMPGLLRNVAHNLNHGMTRCQLYEIGPVFLPGKKAPLEGRRLAFVLAGQGLPAHWSQKPRTVDIYDARGPVELLSDLLGTSRLVLSSDKMPFLSEGLALSISHHGQSVGWLGEITPSIRQRFGIDQPVYGGEIAMETLEAELVAARRYRPLPRYPGVRRDLALVVKQDTRFDDIERVVRTVNTVPIEEVQPFDRYRGPGVPKGCMSVAIQILFRHSGRTLTSEEVQSAQDAIVAALDRKLGARLRSPVTD